MYDNVFYACIYIYLKRYIVKKDHQKLLQMQKTGQGQLILPFVIKNTISFLNFSENLAYVY